MVFLIQRSQNKDAPRCTSSSTSWSPRPQGASNRLIDVEDLSEHELELLYQRYQHLAKTAQRLEPGAQTSIDSEKDGRKGARGPHGARGLTVRCPPLREYSRTSRGERAHRYPWVASSEGRSGSRSSGGSAPAAWAWSTRRFDRERATTGRAQDAAPPSTPRALPLQARVPRARRHQRTRTWSRSTSCSATATSGSSRWSWSTASTSSTGCAAGGAAPTTADTVDRRRRAPTRADGAGRRCDARRASRPSAPLDERGCATALRAARRRARRAARRAASCTATSSRRTCWSTPRRPRRAARLRPRHRARRAERVDSTDDRPGRHRRVHGARAGAPTLPRRPAERLVRGRRDALRGAHRAAAVPRARRSRC